MNPKLIAAAILSLTSCAAVSAADRRPTAKSILQRVLDRYDHASTYQATITTRMVTPALVGKTVIQAEMVGDGRARIARSRIRMTSDMGRGRIETVRIDDGATLWSYDHRANIYRQEAR